MGSHPWELPETLPKTLAKFPASERDERMADYEGFYSKSYYVPSLIGYVILGSFVFLVLSVPAVRFVQWLFSDRLHRRKDMAWQRQIRSRLIEAPLAGKRRAAPYSSLSGLLSIRVPGRIHTVIIGCLILLNLLALFAFYGTLPAKSKTFGSAPSQWGRIFCKRTSCMMVVHLPLVILLAGRSSPVALITGISFNTQMLYHRWIARILLVLAFSHAVSNSITRVPRGIYTEMLGRPYVMWGIAAIIFLALLCTLSLTVIRKTSYELFFTLHIIFAVMGLVSIYQHLHLQDISPLEDWYSYVWAACAFWVFDRFVRIVRIVALNFSLSTCGLHGARMTRLEARVLRNSDEQGAAVVHMRVYPTGAAATSLLSLRAGQHAFISVPSVQPLTMHPFSFVGASLIHANDGKPFALDFYAQVRSGFTARLARKVVATGDAGIFTCRALVEAPYGWPLEELSSYENVVLVAGGIGITHCLSALLEACQAPLAVLDSKRGEDEEKQRAPRQRRITLLWVTRSDALYEPFQQHLQQATALLEKSGAGVELYVKHFHNATAAQEDRPDTADGDAEATEEGHVARSETKQHGSSEGLRSPAETLHSNDERASMPQLDKIEATSPSTAHASSDEKGTYEQEKQQARGGCVVRDFYGRPDLTHELQAAVEKAPPLAQRTAVVSCGSDSFSDWVRAHVSDLRLAGSTMDLFDEVFAW